MSLQMLWHCWLGVRKGIP